MPLGVGDLLVPFLLVSTTATKYTMTRHPDSSGAGVGTGSSGGEGLGRGHRARAWEGSAVKCRVPPSQGRRGTGSALALPPPSG